MQGYITNITTNVIRNIPAVKLITVMSANSPTNAPHTNDSVTLAWSPSTNASVVNYIVKIAQDNLTNWISSYEAGDNAYLTISNFPVNVTNYFEVTAVDGRDVESLPSSIVAYSQYTLPYSIPVTFCYSNQYTETIIGADCITTNNGILVTNLVTLSNIVVYSQPKCYISWDTTNGNHSFAVLYATNFAEHNYWHLFTNVLTYTNGKVTIIDANQTMQKFYALIVQY